MKKLFLFFILITILVSLTGCFLFDPEPYPVPPGGWGYVTVTGRILDVHHNPIPNADAFILQDGHIIGKTKSSIDGSYFIDHALVELNREFYIKATSTEYVDYMSEIYKTIVVNKDSTFKCDIWLRKSNETIIVSYSGYVKDSSSHPIEGAQITVYFLTASGTPANASTISNSEGYYEIINFLPRSNWEISFRVSKDGFDGYLSNPINIFYDQQSRLDFTLYHPIITVNVIGKTIDELGNGIKSSVSLNGYSKTSFSFNISTDDYGIYIAQGITIERDTILKITAIKEGYIETSTNVLTDTSNTYYPEDLVLLPIM